MGLIAHLQILKRSYLKVVEQIELETAISLTEPHFKIYVSNTLSNLSYSVSLGDKAIAKAFDFCKEFSRYVKADPQAITVLKCLQAKYKTGLISNLSFLVMQPGTFWKLII